mmetsp:Transcript_83998/g.246364  ORF Transcript_83998/g.246364 Transcript_83998/m.246364 type:complete len:254 (-) Transcript_83998:3474-4235(-)
MPQSARRERVDYKVASALGVSVNLAIRNLRWQAWARGGLSARISSRGIQAKESLGRGARATCCTYCLQQGKVPPADSLQGAVAARSASRLGRETIAQPIAAIGRASRGLPESEYDPMARWTLPAYRARPWLPWRLPRSTSRAGSEACRVASCARGMPGPRLPMRTSPSDAERCQASARWASSFDGRPRCWALVAEELRAMPGAAPGPAASSCVRTRASEAISICRCCSGLVVANAGESRCSPSPPLSGSPPSW